MERECVPLPGEAIGGGRGCATPVSDTEGEEGSGSCGRSRSEGLPSDGEADGSGKSVADEWCATPEGCESSGACGDESSNLHPNAGATSGGKPSDRCAACEPSEDGWC